ncbi:hypothetical protein GCM10010512_22820 [Streptomyces thermoviolaceus subsp. thermoviolaceus]|nr:hypothetical protein GCM10010512_22820 [Streptomyces thermoviolaceus subsp. thermoviolaceus]
MPSRAGRCAARPFPSLLTFRPAPFLPCSRPGRRPGSAPPPSSRPPVYATAEAVGGEGMRAWATCWVWRCWEPVTWEPTTYGDWTKR